MISLKTVNKVTSRVKCAQRGGEEVGWDLCNDYKKVKFLII